MTAASLVNVKNLPHESALYAGARATVAKVIGHRCHAVNTGLCSRSSVVPMPGALLLVLLILLAILLPAFAHLGPVLVDTQPTF
jgi:hypothetical protein